MWTFFRGGQFLWRIIPTFINKIICFILIKLRYIQNAKYNYFVIYLIIKIMSFVGLIACGLTIILNILPIFSIINFMSKKSNFETIPASKIFTNYANCLMWYFYGRIIFCSPIRISNMIGSIFSLILIVIYLIFELNRYFGLYLKLCNSYYRNTFFFWMV